MPRKRRPRRLINRYAQSRLYDVKTRTYVSVEQLRDLPMLFLLRRFPASAAIPHR
uniref:hypothetical protein n=1 Tax=Methylobacterium sp. B34 TaxID=95563 RepID=UPI0003484DAA|nr:hypothetical protein [Methylobacterium sp. B34]